MPELFAAVQPFEDEPVSAELPMYRDVQWDFARNQPIFIGDSPKICEGIEAVKSWCARALQSDLGLYATHTADYGSELRTLFGQTYTAEVKESEAKRYIEEALLVSPYVTAVSINDCRMENRTLVVSATISTVYGDTEVDKWIVS